MSPHDVSSSPPRPAALLVVSMIPHILKDEKSKTCAGDAEVRPRRRTFVMCRILLTTFAGLFLLGASTADWPMAGSDARRSGHSPQDLAAPLTLHWTYQAQH